MNTTMGCHLTPIRMATIKKTSNRYELGHREDDTLVLCREDCKTVQPLWEIA